MLIKNAGNFHLAVNNAFAIEAEMRWLGEIIDTRLNLYWGNDCSYSTIHEILPPGHSSSESFYGQFLAEHKLNFTERVILILALVPNILPHLLDVFFVKNATYERNFTEFGGVKGQNHSGFIPTGETAAFILCGTDIERRFKLFETFNPEHVFFKQHILKLNTDNNDEPFLSGVLCITAPYLKYFTKGKTHQPDFAAQFPAKLISTKMDWHDLILDEHTHSAIDEIRDWIKYGKMLLEEWEMEKYLKPGYRSLFYGPPGTGKTLTVTLLGKTSGLDVYRVDLSMMISKYIGETEKNLAQVFDQAEHKNWILFFDEADALFGKRTVTSNANDRYANQEVSYLLQRIEDYPGIVILATNLKANMDDAFSRRFQSMIYFPMPGAQQRFKLWQHAIPKQVKFGDDVDLFEIAEKFELSGGAINNISLYVLLKAAKRKDYLITETDLIDGIRKEFAKDGKTVGK